MNKEIFKTKDYLEGAWQDATQGRAVAGADESQVTKRTDFDTETGDHPTHTHTHTHTASTRLGTRYTISL